MAKLIKYFKRAVRIDSIKDMEFYFRVIGSNNKKHLEKYYN